MTIIEYSETGEAVSDFNIIAWAEKKILHEKHICVCSEIAIHAFRVLVKRGLIPHTEIEFLYNKRNISVDKFGELERWPPGFCDTKEILLSELIGYI